VFLIRNLLRLLPARSWPLHTSGSAIWN
jgi:hypothetical protein